MNRLSNTGPRTVAPWESLMGSIKHTPFETKITSTALRILSQPRLLATRSDATERLYVDYLRRSQWAEMESMAAYLQKALQTTSSFVSQSKLSSEEQKQFEVINNWFQTEYEPQKTTLLPFHKLEAVGKTFESFGEDYLTGKEIDFYLEKGVLGPLPVRSLNKEHLKSITDKFLNFNQDYFRNLGSLYTVLKHRCMLELATNSEILAKVSSILGDNIMLCNISVHEIGAGNGKSSLETNGEVDAFNCHSDLSSGSHYYFRPGANQVEGLVLDNRGVCVWVSISGTHKENSPLYFFPKTHLWEITTPFTHIEKARHDPAALTHVLKLLALNHRNPARRMGLCNLEYESLLSSPSVLAGIYRTEIYTKPGDIILFNQHTRHGSGFNASPQARLAISMRFNTALKEVGGTETAGPVVTQTERELLGFKEDKRKPMVQLLGDRHHPNNVPISLKHLFAEAL